jgi:hypothetical protein
MGFNSGFKGLIGLKQYLTQTKKSGDSSPDFEEQDTGLTLC